MATLDKRIIITQDNDFKKWVKPKGAGVFIIPSYLSNNQIDIKLSEFISGKDPGDFLGKSTKI